MLWLMFAVFRGVYRGKPSDGVVAQSYSFPLYSLLRHEQQESPG